MSKNMWRELGLGRVYFSSSYSSRLSRPNIKHYQLFYCVKIEVNIYIYVSSWTQNICQLTSFGHLSLCFVLTSTNILRVVGIDKQCVSFPKLFVLFEFCISTVCELYHPVQMFLYSQLYLFAWVLYFSASES